VGFIHSEEFRNKKRRERRGLVENTHVQIELIEERL
jgi:hypothetical protein